MVRIDLTGEDPSVVVDKYDVVPWVSCLSIFLDVLQSPGFRLYESSVVNCSNLHTMSYCIEEACAIDMADSARHNSSTVVNN